MPASPFSYSIRFLAPFFTPSDLSEQAWPLRSVAHVHWPKETDERRNAQKQENNTQLPLALERSRAEIEDEDMRNEADGEGMDGEDAKEK